MNTHELRVASGTCWNEKQLAEIIERHDRYGEMVKMEIVHGFSPGKKMYHWIIWARPELNVEVDDEGPEDGI